MRYWDGQQIKIFNFRPWRCFNKIDGFGTFWWNEKNLVDKRSDDICNATDGWILVLLHELHWCCIYPIQLYTRAAIFNEFSGIFNTSWSSRSHVNNCFGCSHFSTGPISYFFIFSPISRPRIISEIMKETFRIKRLGLCIIWYCCFSLSESYLWFDKTWFFILHWWSNQ